VHQNVFGGLAPHRPTGEGKAIPRVGVGRKWKRKEGRGRGVSGVSDRDETITGWWGDK